MYSGALRYLSVRLLHGLRRVQCWVLFARKYAYVVGGRGGGCGAGVSGEWLCSKHTHSIDHAFVYGHALLQLQWDGVGIANLHSQLQRYWDTLFVAHGRTQRYYVGHCLFESNWICHRLVHILLLRLSLWVSQRQQ